MQEEILNTIKQFEKSGFIKHNNIKIDEVNEDYAKLYVEISESSLNPNNTAHGGLIFGLADSAMGLAARTTGKNIVTVNAQIDYIKKGKGKILYAEAKPLKIGRTISVYRCEVQDENNNLIASVTATFYYIN